MVSEPDALTELRVIADRLPEVIAVERRSLPAWQVRRRVVLYFHPNGSSAHRGRSIWCPAPPGVAAEMADAEPDRFFQPTASASGVFADWLGVALDAGVVDWTEIGQVVADAYRTVAPKTLIDRMPS